MMHEGFIDAETFSKKSSIPLQITQNIVGEHSTGERFGQLMNIAKPKLGVAYHYFLDDDVIDPFFRLLHQTYDGPVVLAQDLMVINVTPEQIVTRLAETNLLHWTPQVPPDKRGDTTMAPRSKSAIPEWVRESKIEVEG